MGLSVRFADTEETNRKEKMLKLLIVLVLFSHPMCHADDDKPHHLLECPDDIVRLALQRFVGTTSELQRDAIRCQIEDQFDCDLD